MVLCNGYGKATMHAHQAYPQYDYGKIITRLPE
jgi:hypothetical protein